MAVKRQVTPEQLLEGVPPPVAVLARELRAVAHDAVPGAIEVGYGGWRAIGYRHPRAGYLFGIFLSETAVKLFFEYGSFLPDPRRVLHGDGRGRWVEFNDAVNVPAQTLIDLMRASLDFRLQATGATA